MEAPNKLNGMGTWRRYKLGQAQFTSWLKQTAEKLVSRKNDSGEKRDEAGDPDSTPQQSRRQKKKAKSAGSGVGISLDTGTGKFVHWSQLEVLAQRVVDNATPDDVPDAALNILRDVVSLRKKSFSFFSSSAKNTDDEKLKQSNANHAHIINVLERVLARLEVLVKARRSSQPKPKSTDNSRVATSDLSNMFAFLELQTDPDTADDAAVDQLEEEEPAAEPKGGPQKGGKKKGGKKLGKPKKHETKPERAMAKTKGGTSWVDKFRFGLPGEDEDEEDEFDLYMMVYCFFEDFNAIRNHVAERWCDYWYDRSVPLDTLAVVTNAAFELFHQLEYDLVRELRPLDPKLARYDFMMSMLFYHYGIDHIDYASYDGLTDDEQDERIWRDEADWLALESHFTLQRTLESIPPGKVPMLAPSRRSPTVYGARTLDEWKTFESLVTNQIILEGAHLKALKVNQQEPPVLPTESLLLLDFQDCLKRNSYNSSLIFSLHLWVDIRNIMESDHDKPFEELQTTATKLKEALEKHNPTKYRKDHDFKRAWIGRLWETKHYMVEDFLFEDKKARFRQIGIEEDPEPFFLLRHEPVWTGLLDFRAKLVYSQLGHEFVLLSSVVEAAAYLYYAARAADPDLPRWENMDEYVDTHKIAPQNRESATAIIREYAEAKGGKPGQDRGAAHPADDNDLIPEVAVRQSLYQRYAFDERRAPFVDYLGELTAQRLQIERTERQGARNALALSGTNTADARKEVNDGSLAVANGVNKTTDTELDFQRDSELSRLSPIRMLELLDETVTSQVEGLLTLDYFKLFDESAALLEAVATGFGPDMENRLGPHDGESPTNFERLPILLGQDLKDSQGSERETDITHIVVATCREVLQGLV